MSIRGQISSFFSQKPRPKRKSSSLYLERLEDRCTPSALTYWTANSQGNWGASANWSNGVPSAFTEAVFNNTHTGTCIVDGSYATVAASMNWTGTLQISDLGQLTIGSTGNNTTGLILTNGNILFPGQSGTLNLNGDSSLTNGSISSSNGFGQVNIGDSSKLTISANSQSLSIGGVTVEATGTAKIDLLNSSPVSITTANLTKIKVDDIAQIIADGQTGYGGFAFGIGANRNSYIDLNGAFNVSNVLTNPFNSCMALSVEQGSTLTVGVQWLSTGNPTGGAVFSGKSPYTNDYSVLCYGTTIVYPCTKTGGTFSPSSPLVVTRPPVGLEADNGFDLRGSLIFVDNGVSDSIVYMPNTSLTQDSGTINFDASGTNYQQLSVDFYIMNGGTLNMRIQSTGDSDLISADYIAIYGGTLSVTWDGAPTRAQGWILMQANYNIQGDFTSWNLPSPLMGHANLGPTYVVSYSPN